MNSVAHEAEHRSGRKDTITVDQDPTSGGARPDSDGASTLDLSGRCVGNSYILIRPIGQGATGTVWRGVDRGSGEAVAVKLLHESLMRQPKLVTRFVQERMILLMLRHRNVVRVRDLFSVGESLGLVMDLVPGGSLREYLREHHTLGPGQAARLAAQVAAALAEAHDLGIVHRDLKPDNILLHREGGRLDIRLTDFGIARVLNTPGLTTTGAVVGTPHYMAPEAFQSSPASPAADVYALGVLLYEMVCGRPPYDSDNVHDLMGLHLRGEPERLPGIPDALWDLVTACLEQKPRLRPCAGELLAELSDVARRTGDVPALPKPAKAAARQRQNSRTPDPDPDPPAKPVHPSLAGLRRWSAPRRRNQPASWRWGRPWATVTLVAAAMVASGAATTAWHLGRADGDTRGRAAARTTLPATVPSGSAAPSVSAAPAPSKTTTAPRKAARRPDVARVAAQALDPVRPQRARTRVPEATRYGPYACRTGFGLASFNTPLMLSPCHALGPGVQLKAMMSAPVGGTGAISVALQDVRTGRYVTGAKVCANLIFAKGRSSRECGPVIVYPARGRRYRVIMTWTFGAGGRDTTNTARGHEFDW